MSLLSLLALNFTLANTIFQFPEPDHTYSSSTPSDRGFAQYTAPSLYKTGNVVLTFDDGPDPVKTPRLLDILKKYQATATFFVLAEKINDQTSPIIERMLAEGHIVASHDWVHTNNNSETRENFKKDLARSIIKIKDEESKAGIHHNEMYYRFPYGDYGRSKTYHHLNIMKEVSNELFGENCINFVFWDIDTADWVSNMSAEDVKNGIIAHLEGGIAFTHKKVGTGYVKQAYAIRERDILGGGVVLMHDIHDRSVKATELFLEYASKKGYHTVPLSSVKEFSYGNRVCNLLSN